jgi:hypothetical protein
MPRSVVALPMKTPLAIVGVTGPLDGTSLTIICSRSLPLKNAVSLAALDSPESAMNKISVGHKLGEDFAQGHRNGVVVGDPLQVAAMEPSNEDHVVPIASWWLEADWKPSLSGPYVQLCFYRDEVSTILVGDMGENPFSLVTESPDLELLSVSSDGSFSTSDDGQSTVSSLSQCSTSDESDSSPTTILWFDTAWYLGDTHLHDEIQIALLHEVASDGVEDDRSHGCGKLFLRSLTRLTLALPAQAYKSSNTREWNDRWTWIEGNGGSYAPLDINR